MEEAADSDENVEMKILAKEDQQIIRDLANEDLEMDQVVGLNGATNFQVPSNGLWLVRACIQIPSHPHQHSIRQDQAKGSDKLEEAWRFESVGLFCGDGTLT